MQAERAGRTLCGVAAIAAHLGIDAGTARTALRRGLVEGAWQGPASGEWMARNPRVSGAVIPHDGPYREPRPDDP
jgi:hypothetical protein